MNKEELIQLKNELKNKNMTNLIAYNPFLRTVEPKITLEELEKQISNSEETIDLIEKLYEKSIIYYNQKDNFIYDTISITIDPIFYISDEYESRLENKKYDSIKPSDILQIKFLYPDRTDNGELIDEDTDDIFDNEKMPIVIYSDFIKKLNERGMNISQYNPSNDSTDNIEKTESIWQNCHNVWSISPKINLNLTNKKNKIL